MKLHLFILMKDASINSPHNLINYLLTLIETDVSKSVMMTSFLLSNTQRIAESSLFTYNQIRHYTPQYLQSL